MALAKDRCRKRRRKCNVRTLQVIIEKVNISEKLSKCRKSSDDIKTEDEWVSRDEPIGYLFTGWAMSGIEMARAQLRLFCGTAGACSCDAKGDGQEKKIKALSIDVRHMDGPISTSVEASVMAVEQKDRVNLSRHVSTREGMNA